MNGFAKAILVLVFILFILALAIPVRSTNPGSLYNTTYCGPTHVIAAGEDLSVIANRCETTVDAIMAANPGLREPSDISPGQRIIMPVGAVPLYIVEAQSSVQPLIPNTGAVDPPSAGTASYIVQPGDTLSQLAQRYNTTVAVLMQLNPFIGDPDLIYVGQVLQVP